jgi:hypothetical protein
MKERKYYYVFSGQNASTGTPNRITGNYSFYGRILKFSSKSLAIKFTEKNYSPYNRDICQAGTARTLRKYCMGMSVRDYEEYLHYMLVDEAV